MARLSDAVTVHQPALAFLVPTHQNPTGLVLPAAERHEIVALAERHPGVTFVDDMTVAEISLAGPYTEPQPPPLAALASRLPNVVTVGSLSKTYWGGLRTGWVRAPEGIIDRLAAAKAAGDLGSPPHAQGLIARVMPPRTRTSSPTVPTGRGSATPPPRRHSPRPCPTGSGPRRAAG